MDLTPEERSAMRYWQEIEAVSSSGGNVQDLWEALNERAEELGLSSPGVTVRGVSGLWSKAVSIQNSGRRFEVLADNVRLDAKAIGEAPWSREPGSRGALGIYQVRFQHTTITADGPETNWRTSLFYAPLPKTAGELRERLQQDAEQLANKYGVAHADFSSVQIMAV